MKTIFKTFFAAFFLLSTFTYGQDYEKYLGKDLFDVKNQLKKENITNYYDLGYENNYYISWIDTFENTEVTVICSFPYENSYKCSSVMINLGPSTRVGITELIRKLLKRGYKLNDVTYKSLDNDNHTIPHFLKITNILNPFEPYGQSFTINKHDQVVVYSEKELDRTQETFK